MPTGSMSGSGLEVGGHWRDRREQTQKPVCWSGSEQASFSLGNKGGRLLGGDQEWGHSGNGEGMGFGGLRR